MKFKFTCELCNKEVKRGDKFHVDLFQRDDETSSTGVDGADEMCKQCAGKLERKMDSIRKQAAKGG